MWRKYVSLQTKVLLWNLNIINTPSHHITIIFCTFCCKTDVANLYETVQNWVRYIVCPVYAYIIELQMKVRKVFTVPAKFSAATLQGHNVTPLNRSSTLGMEKNIIYQSHQCFTYSSIETRDIQDNIQAHVTSVQIPVAARQWSPDQWGPSVWQQLHQSEDRSQSQRRPVEAGLGGEWHPSSAKNVHNVGQW